MNTHARMQAVQAMRTRLQQAGMQGLTCHGRRLLVPGPMTDNESDNAACVRMFSHSPSQALQDFYLVIVIITIIVALPIPLPPLALAALEEVLKPAFLLRLLLQPLAG